MLTSTYHLSMLFLPRNVRLVCRFFLSSWQCLNPCKADSFLVINIHGGAFMLGSSKMINRDQVSDCLSRGWIVLGPNHRLCPQVNLLEGPIQDCRDLLAWIHEGGLATAVRDLASSSLVPDLDHVFAFGTSSGGHLSLCLVGYSTLAQISLWMKGMMTYSSTGIRSSSSRCWSVRHVWSLQF